MTEKPKKKILFLITKSNWGGGQRYVYDLAVRLNPEDFDVAVALGGDGELAQNLKAAGIRVIHIEGLQRDVSFKKELLASKHIAAIIRKEKPDILHVNSSKAGAIGAFLGRLFGIKKVVFTALGWAFNEERPRWQKFLIKGIHWGTVLLAHHTIALSNGIKEQMNWPFVQKKIHVVHLGRHVTELKDKDTARRFLEQKVEEAGFSKPLTPYHTDLWIGSLSELHPIKQVHRIVDAMATLVHEFPHLRYVMIGDGQERERLLAQIKALNLESHVFLTGAIFEAGRLLSALDVFVFPSRSEAFGYVLLEAGAASVPVVASRVGGICDVVTDETGLLVDPHDTQSLTDAIRKFLIDPSLCTRLGEMHHTRSKLFTIEKMVSETLTLYQQT